VRTIARNILAAAAAIFATSTLAAAPVDLGGRRELFVDHYLIERMDGVRLEIGRPERAEVVLRFDRPWERSASFVTVLKDGREFRMYYRGRWAQPGSEVTCYAESRDGISWTRPMLGLHRGVDGEETNIILVADSHNVTHNFAPMLDDRPGVPPDQRYKAVGGKGPAGGPGTGLVRLVSADGIHWRRLEAPPLFVGYALDSHNVISWLPAEQCYAIYLRTWTDGGVPSRPKFRGFRTVSRATSKDFVNWTEPQPMSFGDTEPEHIYTNNTHPYFRAPHILVALPRRYLPLRQAYPVAQQLEWGVPEAHAKGIADAVLMTSRGGTRYDRTFMESFVRPGPDPLAWHARENPPSMGVVPTGAGEMSFYVVNHFPMPSLHLTRVRLRTDGFASVRAGYAPGTLVTKPFTFTGTQLELNVATSAAGGVMVELLDDGGRVLASSPELIGDEVARIVPFRGIDDVRAFSGPPVRLRFTLRDADLYSFKFNHPKK
jgi:hypothetical protein